MDGYKFEKKCAAMLRRQGFTHVQIIGGSGDQGVDILARKHRRKYGIQCKYYSSPVGNHAVQQAFAGARYYDCDIAAVMTNSTYTEGARALAERTDVRLWQTQAEGFGCLSHLWWLSLAGAAGMAALLYLLLPLCLPDSALPGLLHLCRAETAAASAGAAVCIWNRRSWLLSCTAGMLFLGAIGCEIAAREQLVLTDEKTAGILLAMTGVSFLAAVYLRKVRRAEPPL